VSTGLYVHTPGRLSRWGVVDVGLKCVHKCKFCYYSFLDGSPDQFAGMAHAKFQAVEHLNALVDSLAQNGFVGFDVTGGEPALSPSIVQIVRRAVEHGLAARIITLGQYLMRAMRSAPGHARLIDGLLEAGVADFLLSIHAVEPEAFDAITGGSWIAMRSAMEYLDEKGFDYCSNTTVFEDNFRSLPAIARELAKHRVYVANFIVMNAYYAWGRPDAPTRKVQAHYSEIRPYLLEARDLLEEAGIAVNVRYAPLCTMRGMERNLVGIAGVRHDPHEWMNAIDHMRPGPGAEMGRRLALHDYQMQYRLEPPTSAGTVAHRADKIFPKKCRSCRAISICDGIDRRYLCECGTDELEPYSQFRGDLLDRERLAYLPAFVVKTAPYADACRAVSSMLRGDHVVAS